jgi:hypothetical protein
MRSVGLGFAFAASFQLVLASTPAFAQPPAAAPDAPAKDAPAAAPATPAPAATPGTVTVHVNAPQKVSLEHRAAGHETWDFACNSPCDQALSSTDEYRIVGAGLNESHAFKLDTSNGDKITLDVTPGTHSKYTTGEWVLIGGGVFIVGGVVALLAGSSSNAVQGADGTVTSSKNTNWIFVGTSLIVAGVIGGLVGGSFMYDNAHTHVDGGTPVDEKKTNEGVSLKVTASRAPTWHEDTGPTITAVPNIVPLFQRSF